jgi:hypothetical protein
MFTNVPKRILRLNSHEQLRGNSTVQLTRVFIKKYEGDSISKRSGLLDTACYSHKQVHSNVFESTWQQLRCDDVSFR